MNQHTDEMAARLSRAIRQAQLLERAEMKRDVERQAEADGRLAAALASPHDQMPPSEGHRRR